VIEITSKKRKAGFKSAQKNTAGDETGRKHTKKEEEPTSKGSSSNGKFSPEEEKAIRDIMDTYGFPEVEKDKLLEKLANSKYDNLSQEEWNRLHEEACDRLQHEREKDHGTTEDATRPKPSSEESDEQAKQAAEELYRSVSTVDFPGAAKPEAFYGIAGEVVRTMCDGSELRPEAVLAQFLCIFGNMLGRGPHKEQESRHGTVINVAVVGRTADGAKGGSIKAVKKLMNAVYPTYCADKFTGGHNSAESILEEIRDEVWGFDEHGTEVIKEPEVLDKRLIIIEEELSRLFQVSKRDGCTLSEFIREFFDSPEIVKAKSRKSRLESTKPHVSVIGHITPEGLKSSLKSVELFNGLANRFIFIASKRTCSIPEPARVDWSSDDLAKKVKYLQALITTFRPKVACKENKDHEFTFSEVAREKWHEIYKRLSEESAGKSGMHGAIIARAKPTLLRLSIIYAALDMHTVIEPQHLAAAEALWSYSAASALWAFGENSGNPDADKILRYLNRCGGKGASKTAIRMEVFNNHIATAALNDALAYLKAARLARVVAKGKSETWYKA